MYRKLLAILLSLTLVAGLAVGCGQSQDPSGTPTPTSSGSANPTAGNEEKKTTGFNIGFANAYIGNSWRAQFLAGIEDTFKEYQAQGIVNDYQVASSNSDVTEQINQLNTMLNSDLDAIIIDPVSPTSIGPIIEKAQEKGILVVIAENVAPYEGVYAIGPRVTAYSTIITEHLLEKIDYKGNIVKVTGVPGNSTTEIHKRVSDNIIKQYPDVKVLASATGKWSDAESQITMSNFLSAYDNLAGVWSEDGMSLGIINAFNNAGREMVPVSGDYFKIFIDYWAEHPEIESISVPNPCSMGATSIKFTVNLLQGKEVDESLLEGNPLDESIKNWIPLDPPFVVCNEEDKDAEYLKPYPKMVKLTPQEAAEILKGLPDSTALDINEPTDEDIDALFK